MNLFGIVRVKCPGCSRKYLFLNTPAGRSGVYVRMFTHIRLSHWSDYLAQAKAEIAALNKLVD